MKRFALTLVLAAALPVAAAAQATKSTPKPAPKSTAKDASSMESHHAGGVDPADAALAAMRDNWQQATDNIRKAAEEISEADYAYKPVETVRTFGQIIGHVAGSQAMMCAAALGDPIPAEDAVEKAATTKAALLDALKSSTTYCAKAYAQDGHGAAKMTDLFGQKGTRFNALALNAVHNGEHYGNIITYMRMKGMVPPSSKR
jgi:uncharacterized damage-inducible protein DinB